MRGYGNADNLSTGRAPGPLVVSQLGFLPWDCDARGARIGAKILPRPKAAPVERPAVQQKDARDIGRQEPSDIPRINLASATASGCRLQGLRCLEVLAQGRHGLPGVAAGRVVLCRLFLERLDVALVVRDH